MEVFKNDKRHEDEEVLPDYAVGFCCDVRSAVNDAVDAVKESIGLVHLSTLSSARRSGSGHWNAGAGGGNRGATGFAGGFGTAFLGKLISPILPQGA